MSLMPTVSKEMVSSKMYKIYEMVSVSVSGTENFLVTVPEDRKIDKIETASALSDSARRWLKWKFSQVLCPALRYAS